MLLGNGSNLLLGDDDLEALVLRVSSNFGDLIVKDDLLIAPAGVKLLKLVKLAREYEANSLDFLAYIPGHVGGSVVNNAGAFGSNLDEHLHWVEGYTLDGCFKRLDRNEIDFSYEMNENAVLVLSYGIERVLGNSFTDLGDNIEPSSTNLLSEFLGIDKFNKLNRARNQRNRLLGIGFDYKIGENAMLFFRHNRYRYFDPNFVENHLQGTETMLELKITF